MAGTITAGAVANIAQAAREAGIAPDRVIEALESVPYTVTWDDGGLSGSEAELRAAIKDAFSGVGVGENFAELFCDRIVAIDTGLTGVVTGIVPDLDSVPLHTAWQTLLRNNLTVGTISFTADQGAYPIGDVVADQSPAAAANEPAGSAVSFTVQKGETVPNVNDLTFDAAVDAIEALSLVVGNLGSDQPSGTGNETTDVITATSHTLVNGDRVWVRSLAGGTGLSQGGLYYVVGVSGNDFQLAAEFGDTAIDFTTAITEITVAKVTNAIVDPSGAAVDDAVGQDVAAGTFVDGGTTVTFTVGGIAIPDFSTGGTGTGGAQTTAEYTTTLDGAGLKAGTATDNGADSVTAVVSVDDGVGTFVENGSGVDYTYDAV